MRLYRMELYKLFHRKLFITEALAVIGLMLLYFWIAEVDSEISVIDGRVYSGYEAIQMNRKITEEFKGEISNDKIEQIIKKYGLPMKYEENMPGWRDGNYLNDFVTRYFTNGSWETRTIPTERYEFEETELGKVYHDLESSPFLYYTTGWKVFVDMLQFSLVLGSILIICGISVVFAEENQTKMLPVIFTTEEGRNKDVIAKVAASFTLTAIIFICAVILNLTLCKIVYGLDGYDNISGIVLANNWFSPAYRIPFPQYLCTLLCLGFQALLSLCAITLCISAHQSSSFTSVIVSAICWGIPVLLRVFFGELMWIIIYATPVFLIMNEVFSDIYAMWYLVFAINLFVSVVCLIKGAIYYKTRQVA